MDMMELHPILADLHRERQAKIRAALVPFEAAAGEVIIKPGDEPSGLYFIHDGQVEIRPSAMVVHNVHEVMLHKGDGEYFGEMALIERRSHSGMVIASRAVSGLCLPKKLFDELVEYEPEFLHNLARDVLAYTRKSDSDLIHELFRAKTKAETYITKLKSLTAISQQLNSTIDLDELLRIILEEASKAADAEKGAIFLVDYRQNKIVSRVVQGSEIEEIHLPLGSGIAGIVAVSGETINIPDAYADARFNPEIDTQTGNKTRNILTLAMRSPTDKVVGVMQLLNKRHGNFTDQDTFFLKALSVHASIAIEKARLIDDTIRNEAMAKVGQFAATIIHDIHNPMTAILGYTSMLKDIHKEDDRSVKFISTIEAQVNRLVSLSREVMDFAKGKTEFNFYTLPLRKFLEDTVDLVRDEFESVNISLDLSLPKEELEARFDPDRMTRVILNLLSNAYDAMPDGGSIKIKLKTVNKGWSLELIDSGIGISLERLPLIFDPFVTFGKMHGTGLGLSIVKKLIEEQGGSIEVVSELNEGTTFKIVMQYDPERNGQ